MTAEFVHLRLHSEFSLVDSVVRIKPLVKAARAQQMPAIALTDDTNLFGMIKFYKAAEKQGIKPIVGADVRVRIEGFRDPVGIALLCQDLAGYRNLSRLLTRAWQSRERQQGALLEADWLAAAAEGLIVLSGGRQGDVGKALLARHDDVASERLDWWRQHFPDRYYIELQRTGRPQEADYNAPAVRLAAREAVPVVATNDVRFLEPGDFEAHEARVCIHSGYTLADNARPRHYTDQQYLRSPAEMVELFAEVPEAITNSVEIARRCSLEIELGKSVLPDFPVPAGDSVDDFLRAESERGLKQRLEIVADTGIPRDEYDQRLATELDVIIGMGFPGYFLIVADFIRWARENDVPVGPGRGSGAGSLVAWALGITNVDPLQHDLLFERFLNPERVSMPDFDIDFCMERRDRVIDYVARKYGRDQVSQIITFGTMAARAVVRDCGRILGHPYGFVDRVAKLIPFEIGMTLDKALKQDEELRRNYENEEEIRTLIDLARSLEGLARNAGKHAGGVVIAPSALTDYTPLYSEGGDESVSQFDKDDVEAAGLVKFDFLGLRTLTIIDWALATVNRKRQAAGEPTLQLDELPMDDVATFDLLKRCSTTAVFQLESRGMKDLIKRLQPDCFEDIVALVALFRPGPLQSGMVDDFIQRKHGEAAIVYPHPELENILKPTYGVILYQEQVMQIAQDLAGYSLGGADLLRRAMGKKKAAEMARQRSVFLDGARARGVDEKVAGHIFDLMEKFAGYGFNRSHSVAYAVLSYQTAWLKAHYPAAFMAAVLSADMDNTDKVVTLIDECGHLDLAVLGPDVNHSSYMFAAADEQSIRYGLGAIKGVGRAAVESMIAERESNGPFADLHDLCARIDLSKLNKRVFEALIRAGALDGLGPNRASLLAALPTAMQVAEQNARAQAAGQNDLFGLEPVAATPDSAVAIVEIPDWSDAERLAHERDTLGLFLTGHPIEEFAAELARVTTAPIADLLAQSRPTEPAWHAPKRQVTTAGLVLAIRRIGSRLLLTLDDRSGRIEVMLFDEVAQQAGDRLAKDAILLIDGILRFDDFSNAWRLNASRVLSMDEARQQFAQRMIIRWHGGDDPGFVNQLSATLAPHRNGQCAVDVLYISDLAQARVELGEQWLVRPSVTLLRDINALPGCEAELVYKHRMEIAG
ncbi:MAG: DNA polymerase III subunit alpha [Gammaproteobacteria bacterium]|nr:DNA polymerase III subunit alpha [Gammaproteobacteria bacterium]